jgi:hypothetical protein
MTEDSFPEGENDFSPDPDRTEDGFGSQEFGSQESDPFSSSFDPGSSPDEGMDVSFALTMARSWVTEHQTKAMLGAFAAAVVVASLLPQ